MTLLWGYVQLPAQWSFQSECSERHRDSIGFNGVPFPLGSWHCSAASIDPQCLRQSDHVQLGPRDYVPWLYLQLPIWSFQPDPGSVRILRTVVSRTIKPGEKPPLSRPNHHLDTLLLVLRWLCILSTLVFTFTRHRTSFPRSVSSVPNQSNS